MKTIKVKLDSDLEAGVEAAMEQSPYATRELFVVEAVRNKLRDIKAERQKEKAWHALLQSHNKVMKHKWANAGEYGEFLYRPRFGLKDLLKHKHQIEQHWPHREL